MYLFETLKYSFKEYGCVLKSNFINNLIAIFCLFKNICYLCNRL